MAKEYQQMCLSCPIEIFCEALKIELKDADFCPLIEAIEHCLPGTVGSEKAYKMIVKISRKLKEIANAKPSNPC